MKIFRLSIVALMALAIISCKKEGESTSETNEMAQTEVDGVKVATPVNNDGSETKPLDENAPILTLESDIFDFGEVKANETEVRMIQFKNTGKSPLIIKGAKASCGCTTPDFSKEPVAPGEPGFVKVQYKAPANNGKQMKTVTLTTNTNAGTERFKITAMVVGGKERTKPQAPKAPKQALPAPNLEAK